jgi:hypothetical protein
MVVLRALLYSIGVFAVMALISMSVAGIMKLLYVIVHKKEPKPQTPECTKAGSQ